VTAGARPDEDPSVIDPARPDFRNTPVCRERPSFEYLAEDRTAVPYVTIVTPYYDTGPIFHETARSVLQQSFQQWEWVIVDDGSTTAESRQILEDYRRQDTRIRIIRHEVNKGLSAARNTGFGGARTEYVVQLDSDDLLEPTAVEKWLWFLESHPEFGFGHGYTVGFGEMEYVWTKGFHNGRACLDESLAEVTSIVRTRLHRAVGGYDESNRDGMEDVDFWLRCASLGHWGGTIPEHLNWYRRRRSHADRWPNQAPDRAQAFRRQLRQRYGGLWEGGFPEIAPRWHEPNALVSDELPCENRLGKRKPRLLVVVPRLAADEPGRGDVELLEGVTRGGWEVTIAATDDGDHSGLPRFASHTPDVFVLGNFLRLVDYPRFLRYLVQSRQMDTVMIARSELGYRLLPYLRAHDPEVTFVGVGPGDRPDDGFTRLAAAHHELVDLTLVASPQLQALVVRCGADPERVEVCALGAEVEDGRPEGGERAGSGSARRPDTTERLVASLERAGMWRGSKPRPAIARAVARGCAAQAVEHARLVRMSAWLWNEREQQGRGEPSGSGVEGIRGGQESPAGEGGLPIANRLHQRQAWLKAQIASWQGLSDDRWRELCKQQEWIRQLQQGKAWLEEQRDIWERLAREHEGKIDELRAWMGELEQGKAWLEEQQASWRRLAEEREGVIRELRAWVGELEQGKAWLEEQRTSWQRVAEERGRLLQAEQEKRRGIWSRLVSVTRPFRDGGASPDTEPRK
jgi:GT2 family glycosyltransferase/exonuclease VII small subunit